MINIDYSLFLETFDDFKEVLLPIIQKQREMEELPKLQEGELMDFYLDLHNEYFSGKN